ncbi:T9SS C-terminal target domain-containing protein [Sphingobacteriales bacterium UPWRP_1]|nr:hypothetical protein B6N25_03345 [Sphingobacteriales bacterium TSM_CSS]PSJ75028.1 T9SS C-terminal target domain-containing protein [Sphingobacteriales bacterium UPWRP_1]
MTLSQTAFTCANVGNNTVTLTVTDVNNNTAACTATVTVQDLVAPVAVCQNVTVQLDNTGNGSTTAAAVNNGSSDACGIQSLTLSQTAFTCADISTNPNTVTLTVTDVNGNTNTCTATVTVQDLVAPVAVCQPVTVQLNASGTGSTTAAAVNNGSSDACGVTLSLNQTSFTCVNVGSNTVTLTVTDSNNNTATCSATVTVQDLVAPVAVCQPVTVQLDNTGNGSTTAAAVNNGSSDACGIQSLTLSQTAFTCSNVGSNPVTLTVTDVNNNTATCSATVTVQDLVLPVAVCQDVTVQLDNTGNGSTTALAVNNGSSDACGIQSLTMSQTAFTCANVGSNPVTLTVTDVNNNTNTCSAMVTVQDLLPPTAICQDVTVALTLSGTVTINPAQVNLNSTDNCGIQSYGLSQNLFDCTDVGFNTVILTVTDVNGNVSTCSSQVRVIETTAPLAQCQNVTVQLNSSGSGSTTAGAVNNGSSDNCGAVTLALSQTNFTCANLGSNTVTLTVTDANENTATCSATVTVTDNIAPLALCTPVTVQLNSTGNATVTAAQVNSNSTDNCTITGLSVSPSNFTCANLGTNTVTLTVSDQSNNTATCSAMVTVQENTAPVAVCQTVTVALGLGGTATITPAQVNNGSTDNCSIANYSLSQTVFSCSTAGNNTVTLTVTDQSGNTATCSATVIIPDATAPTAICQTTPIPLLLTASGSVALSASALNNGSFDNCGTVSLSAAPGSFTCANIGSNTVVLTVSDASGNTATCTGTVMVSDNIAPVALCQNATVTLNTSGTGTLSVSQINNNSTDNCGTVTALLNNTNYTCSNVGFNTVIMTVTDGSGNSSSCAATVQVLDNTPPAAICQSVTVSLGFSGTATVTPSQVNNGSTDNCGTVNLVSVSPNTFTCATPGNTVVLTVSDASGNTGTCSATVTVTDSTPPSALCKNATVTLGTGGTATLAATQVDNGSFDNCGGANVSVAPNMFTCSNLGANTVVLTATDFAGNTATCSATVMVTDNTAPAAVCQNISVTLGTGGTVSISPLQVNGSSTDNCGTVTPLTVSPNSFSCSNVGNNTVLLTVSDASGNTANCTATVTVGPLLSATATSNSPVCIGGAINLTATGGVSYNWSGPGGYTATGATPTRSGATLSMAGTYNVTVTNSSGCSAVLSTVVSVTSTAAASITGNSSYCVGGTINLTASSGTSYSWSGPNGFASTNAGISLSPATIAMGGSYTVTVSNGGGCTASASKTITVSAAPAAAISGSTGLCAGGTITLTASGGSSYAWSYPGGLSASGSTVTRSNATLAMGGTYTVTVTNTAGCTATAGTTVTVNAAPAAAAVSNSPVCVGSSINLTASGGVSYAWSGPNGYTSTAQNPVRNGATASMAGNYMVTVTGAGGCTATAVTSVTVNASPIVSVSGSSSLCSGGTITLTATSGFGSYSWSGPNGFTGTGQSVSLSGATTAATGSYTVTVTNAAGCTGSASRSVTVNALPAATAGSNSPVCSGSNITLTATGGTSYAWSGPGGYVSSAQNPVRTGATLAMGGTYTVTVTGAGGCTATAGTVVSVTSCGGGSLVVLTYSITKNSSTTLTGNGSITLNVSGGVPCTGASVYNYTWSPATGTLSASGTTATYSGLLAGTYTVTITDCGGNTLVQTYIVPNVTRGFKTGGDLAGDLQASPNPTSGMTTISFTSYTNEQAILKVYSVEGREVGVLFNDVTQPDTIYEFAFDMNNLPSGTYYAVLQTESGERQQIRVMVVR